MRRTLLVTGIALLATAASAWAQAAPSHPTTIEIRKSFFGSSYRYQDRKLKTSDLRDLYHAEHAGEAERLLEQSGGYIVIGNALGIPGAIIGGAAAGYRGEDGQSYTGVAIAGVCAMIVGMGFSIAGEQAKEQSAKSFNDKVSEPSRTSFRILPPTRPGCWLQVAATF